MYTRKDTIHPEQIQLLLNNGVLPVSVDYRFVPEVPLREGAMTDVCDALQWVRHDLPQIILEKLPSLEVDGDHVAVIGWSTAGTLAMSTAWTTLEQHVKPPEAILSFYCPTDYEDECKFLSHAFNESYGA